MSKRRYPRGKLRADDEGEVQMAVAVVNNTVMIRFPKPVLWVGLGADDARGIGAKLIQLADKIES